MVSVALALLSVKIWSTSSCEMNLSLFPQDILLIVIPIISCCDNQQERLTSGYRKPSMSLIVCDQLSCYSILNLLPKRRIYLYVDQCKIYQALLSKY